MRMSPIKSVRCWLVVALLLVSSREARATAIVSFTPGDIFEAAASDIGAGFAFPGTFVNNTGGRFGPDFEFSDATAVPEPTSIVLLLTGAAGAGCKALRRRRRRPFA